MCESKLKLKSVHFRLPSASQKRACLSSLITKQRRPLRVITRATCKHRGCQCVRFPRFCLSANTKPREKVSNENYEPYLQLSHGRSLYYDQIGSRVAQLWNCCIQPEPPFYVLLTLFPRLCHSVHGIPNYNQRNRPCKQQF